MPLLRVCLLGRPQVWLDDAPLTGFGTAKTEALLYYLAATGRTHSRAELARLLWGDMPDDKARRNLTQSLSTLRKLVEPYLLLERQGVGLNPSLSLALDVAAFERAAAETASLAEAEALYQGDFLAGFFVKEAQDFEEWALVERERLRELELRVLESLAAAEARAGRYAPAARHARRLLELDPWREAAHRQLMELLARQGQHSAALAQYEKCRQLLAAELGVEPMAETSALYDRIRLARQAVLPPLPAEAEPFIGRAQVIAELRRLLADPACRLVTLVAAGGMGKTRLALALARQVNQEGALQFLNGVVFVSLADVVSPDDLPAAMAAALEVPAAGRAHPAEAVLDYLRNKEMLLVLDNFEHLAEGAASLGPLLSQCPHVKLLATSREPLYLAAEWRFHLEGLAYPNDPAAPEPAGSLGSYEAVQLFVQAARQVQPGYTLLPEAAPHVARLCALTGGMPLALKLAAAWVRVLPIEQIVAELTHSLDLLATPLRDVPPRQRSLRAVFECAYERLAAPEQRALAALSVFRGSFGPGAAGAVAGATAPVLAALVDRALVSASPGGRHAMHLLLRQFAAAELAQWPEAERAARQAHADYYLDRLRTRQPALNSPEQHAAIAAITADLDNLQAAWRWAVEQRAVEAVAAVIDPLYTYCQASGRLQEGSDLLGYAVACWQAAAPPVGPVLSRLIIRWGAVAAALADYPAATERLEAGLAQDPPPAERALALQQLGWIAIDRADLAAAQACLRESLALCRAAGDRAGEAEALLALAKAAFEPGDFVPARALAAEALSLCRALGRPDRIAAALSMLAWPTNSLGAYGEAEAYWREALALYQALGDTLGAAMSVEWLGWGAWCAGGPRLPQAIACYEEALVTYRRLGRRQPLAMCLGDLALALLEQGEGPRAVHCAREGQSVARAAGIYHLVTYTSVALGASLAEAGDRPAGRQALAAALQTSLDLGKQDAAMLALYFLARLRLHDEPPAAIGEALEHLAVVARHPATWAPIRDRARRLLAEHGAAVDAAAADTTWEALTERLRALAS